MKRILLIFVTIISSILVNSCFFLMKLVLLLILDH